MHHSTGNAPSAQHTRALQQDVVLGCTRKERRTDRDLSWYMRLPPFVENSKAPRAASKHLQAQGCAPRSEGKGQPGAKLCLGRVLHLCPQGRGSPAPHKNLVVGTEI